jgi:hypothetical protein
MHVVDLVLGLNGIFLHVPTLMWPPLCSSRSSLALHAMQYGCLPFLAHPLDQLKVVTVLFVLHSSVMVLFGIDFEVMDGHGIEKKEVNNK